jgi:very-short-patch-repair endonuclease
MSTVALALSILLAALGTLGLVSPQRLADLALVLAQVQLSRFLGVKKGHNSQSWMNRINRMSADFVVCSKDASVLAVVELDDASHERAVRQDADVRKEKALSGAGVRLIRWRATALPDATTIKATLLASPSPDADRPMPVPSLE